MASWLGRPPPRGLDKRFAEIGGWGLRLMASIVMEDHRHEAPAIDETLRSHCAWAACWLAWALAVVTGVVSP